ncbi:GRAM domain-containing protein [Demequina lutea]|uniref:GRAM domain-containing protein n=1 Tax=Demequina lutea TaxID=431489 RepID=A0A7Y9ZEM5_9MICO|nr:GRAM domain-containing protein [Demequina lutea]NYI42565.1 hypothetical protein [Demequina lutea]
MKTQLREGETTIKSGGAKLRRGIEAVGGMFYFTNQRLVFESHGFNIQTGAVAVELSDIQSLEQTYTKLFGFIRMFKNALLVTSKAGDSQLYTLNGIGSWMTELAPLGLTL